MMLPKLYERSSLNPRHSCRNLKKGDVAVVIDYIPHPSGGEQGAILEIFNAIGESIAVITVPVSAISPLRSDQLPTVRPAEITNDIT